MSDDTSSPSPSSPAPVVARRPSYAEVVAHAEQVAQQQQHANESHTTPQIGTTTTESPTISPSTSPTTNGHEEHKRERRPTFAGQPILIPSDIDELVSQEKLHITEPQSWRVLVTYPNVACWAKEYGKTGFDSIRAVCYIKGHTLETVTKLIYDTDINRKWNLFWEIQEDMGDIADMNACIYVLSKVPFMGIARREFVQFRHQTYVDKNTSVILYRNGNHPQKQVRTGAVRGQSLGITGYVMRNVDKMEPFDTATNKKEIIAEDETEDDPALLAAAASADDVPVLSADDDDDKRASNSTSSKAKAMASNALSGAASLGAAAFSKLSLWGRAAASKAVTAVSQPSTPQPEPTSFTANGITIDYVNGGLVKITYITAVDPKGNIPKRAFNFIMSKGPVRWAKTLQSACDTYVCNGGKL